VWRFWTQASTEIAFLGNAGGPSGPCGPSGDASGPPRIAEFDQDGVLRLRALGTGRVTDLVRLPGLDGRSRYVIVGDLVVSVPESEGRWYAYQLENGDLRWWRAFESGAALAGCGPVLCLSRPGAIAGLDRSTGLERWSLTGFGAYKRLGDRWLLITSSLEYDRTALVVDAASGQIKRRVAGWVPLVVAGPGTLVAWRPSAGGGSAGGGSVLALLDVETGAARVFGTADAWYTGPDCFVSSAHLACLGPTRLSIWRLPIAAGAGKMS
jgi:hypothetical protein